MCGVVGYFDLLDRGPVDERVIRTMIQALVHRGPDSEGMYVDRNSGIGFRRLSIVDVEGGQQPICSEDGRFVLACNGEIFNHLDLRRQLVATGHKFKTCSDVEVILHLYEDHDAALLDHLNGQFAFVIYDRARRSLFLARDHFGVCPLFYTITDGLFIYGSEIKAILAHPAAPRELDLTGLDQIISFPGLVSPRTMFKNIASLPSGHYLTVSSAGVQEREYWDLDYPLAGDIEVDNNEQRFADGLAECLVKSVSHRLQADVPVGFYLSGGLDSSIIAGLVNAVSPGVRRHSFSVAFENREMSEAPYQRMVAKHVGSKHHELVFTWAEITELFPAMIWHCECPVKETYNTCSMALSNAARNAGVPVILTGEGADETFAGYIGYRFDSAALRANETYNLQRALESELRERLWGNPNLLYETDHHQFREIKRALYSESARHLYDEFDCLRHPLVNKERLIGRHPLHQRSYLDLKLRLADHLVSDHGDRMALANSVEARYPFLDIDLMNYVRSIPPELQLKDCTEKYILRKAAARYVPSVIANREKFGFHAPGSQYLLKQNLPWVRDALDPRRIRSNGYFDPEAVERLKAQYSRDDFRLNLPYENDLLLIVISFNVFLDVFRMPSLN
jgi:asparagine synthase (glutamine-hydrolysing)